MSFIANLQRQRNNASVSPVVTPRAVLPEAATDGLAATFRDPNRFNIPVNSQFSNPNTALTQYQLQRNYRG